LASRPKNLINEKYGFANSLAVKGDDYGMRILKNYPKMLAVLASLVLFAGLGPVTPAHADSYAVARVTYTSGSVAVQRAPGTQSSGVGVNTPIVPGERVLTGDASRAAFQLPDSSIVRISSDSTIDFSQMPAYNSENYAMPVVQLSSGSAYIETPQEDSDNPVMEVVTPSATVDLLTQGAYRVDVGRDQGVRVSAFNGQADVEAQASTVALDAGQMTLISYGEAPEQAMAIDSYDQDAFARWNNQQDTTYALYEYTKEVPATIPVAIEPYYYELARYGRWVYDNDYHCEVWRPRVAANWRPYSDGYWDQGPWGPAWVSYEPWGWAPSHFGRWAFNVSLGWSWIPGAVWAPAWVDWDIGPGYVGWCPLDYYGYPVSTFGFTFGFGHERLFGHERFVGGNFYVNPATWTVVRDSDFFNRHLRAHVLARERLASLQPGVFDSRLPRLNRRDPAASFRVAYRRGLNGNATLIGSRRHPVSLRGTRAALRPVAPLAPELRAAGSRGTMAALRRQGHERGPAAAGSVFGPSGRRTHQATLQGRQFNRSMMNNRTHRTQQPMRTNRARTNRSYGRNNQMAFMGNMHNRSNVMRRQQPMRMNRARTNRSYGRNNQMAFMGNMHNRSNVMRRQQPMRMNRARTNRSYGRNNQMAFMGNMHNRNSFRSQTFFRNRGTARAAAPHYSAPHRVSRGFYHASSSRGGGGHRGNHRG
jgi:hypothetical protein